MTDSANVNFDRVQNKIRLVNADPLAPTDFLKQIAPLESDYQLLCDCYTSLYVTSSHEVALQLIQSGVAIAKNLDWPVTTLRQLWLIWARMLAAGVIFVEEWNEMTEILNTPSIAAQALGMGITEAQFKHAIEMRAIRSETFLPAFAQRLQDIFGNPEEK